MERAIGDRFKYKNVELEVVKEQIIVGNICGVCYFEDSCSDGIEIVGECYRHDRSDGIDVNFKEV